MIFEQRSCTRPYDFNAPQMQYRFWTLSCAVEPFPGACSKSDSGVLFGSWLAQYPPGSGTKAQLCRKRLQFPPRCVTNALLCLYPNHNHMGPSAALEFSHWQKHTNRAAAAASSLNLSFTFAVTASMNEPLSQHLSQFMGTVSGQSRSKPARGVCFHCHFKWQSLVWTQFWFIHIWSDWKVVPVTWNNSYLKQG